MIFLRVRVVEVQAKVWPHEKYSWFEINVGNAIDKIWIWIEFIWNWKKEIEHSFEFEKKKLLIERYLFTFELFNRKISMNKFSTKQSQQKKTWKKVFDSINDYTLRLLILFNKSAIRWLKTFSFEQSFEIASLRSMQEIALNLFTRSLNTPFDFKSA